MLQLIRADTERRASDLSRIAAVDLGSNSFRLQIGRVVDDQIYQMDSLKESVRLASGLTAEKSLDQASQRRALAALSRFGERLRGFQPEAVRVVGTNTLRVAKNATDFLLLAEEALGFPIDIIGGREEARLIYIGVAHCLPSADHKRLVIDIGGGSTEFIIGRRIEPNLMESLYMGCVGYSMRFFPDGAVDKKRFREAEMAAAQEVERIASYYKALGWDEAIGSSGSARAIADLLELNHLNPVGFSGITWQGLQMLRTLLIRAGSVERMNLVVGVSDERMAVLPGGLAIMCAIFDKLGLEHMGYAGGALRLGVLYDLLGRFHHHDMRDATVRQFKQRYQIDQRQAFRVGETALELLGQLIDTNAQRHDADVRFLRWAADLHEIGISIAHASFHKHGEYILGAADMPGFSKTDQARLAQLVLGQRGKLEKIIGLPVTDTSWHLLFCLRLATVLHRSRDGHALPELHVKHSSSGYQIELPDDWLTNNPLSSSALADESIAWQQIGSGYRIKYVVRRAMVVGG